MLPFPGGCATHPETSKFVLVVIPENSGDCDTQPDRADWSDWDWDDYIYAQQAGGARGRQSAGMRDPLSEFCGDLPGLEAGDITAFLRDLPIPIPSDDNVHGLPEIRKPVQVFKEAPILTAIIGVL